MFDRPKSSVWQRLALITAALATLVPLGSGFWLLLYCFVLPRDRGDAGPGNPPDVEGALTFVAGIAVLTVSVPFAVCTIAAWFRRRWGFIGIAALCGLQLLAHIAVLLRGSPLRPAWLLPAYSGFLAACAGLAIAGAVSLDTPQQTGGFPVLTGGGDGPAAV